MQSEAWKCRADGQVRVDSNIGVRRDTRQHTARTTSITGAADLYERRACRFVNYATLYRPPSARLHSL